MEDFVFFVDITSDKAGWPDYTKTTGQIFMKLGWRIGLSPEYTTVTLNSDTWMNTGIILLLSSFKAPMK